MADQFRKRVCLAGLKRFGLDDQVVVAGGASSRNQVDADRCSGRAVVSRGKLVDDRLHAIRRVLRSLRGFRRLSGMMLLIDTAISGSLIQQSVKRSGLHDNPICAV